MLICDRWKIKWNIELSFLLSQFLLATFKESTYDPMIVLVANSSRIKVVSGKKNDMLPSLDKVGYVFLQFEIWALQGTSIDEEYIECISKFKAMHSSIYGECEY